MGQSFGFVGPVYREWQTRLGAEECINLMATGLASPNSRQPITYKSVPGLAVVTTLESPVRGALAQDGSVFFVGGGLVYELRPDFAVVVRGSVVNDGRRAWLASNGAQGHQVIVTSGGFGYIYDTATQLFTQITDPEFPGHATRVEFIDGYFVVLGQSDGKIALSSLFNGLEWNGADVALRSTVSDRVVAILVDNNDLWLMGTRTLEPWRNTGATFPFEPIEGARIERGVLAPDTVQKINSGFAWLQQSEHGGPSVWFAAMGSSREISTPAIDAMLASYPTVLDAEAYAEEYEGHFLYHLVLPSARTTLVYDFQTQFWHEQRGWDTDTGLWTAHPGRLHVYAYGQHFIGARDSGAVYRQSMDLHDFGGSLRRWLRRTPYVGDGTRRVFHDRLQLMIGTGVTRLNFPDAAVMMRYSDDWGQTWSLERPASMGPRGVFDYTVEWWQMGSSEGARVYEVSGWDPIPITITDAQIDVRAGR